jgi:hypothetical protein
LEDFTGVKSSLALLVFFLLAVIPLASAQQIYTQPMYTIAWTSKTILVSVPDDPAWAKQAFETAMQNWNQAQAWFLASYEPEHQDAKYTLELAENGQTPQVTVTYVPDKGQQWWGLTSLYGRAISIVLSRFGNGYNGYSLERLAEHELGHTMGIYDNCVRLDLMYGTCNGILGSSILGNYPSTLDLYAIFQQAISNGGYAYGDSVTLPTQISYSTWSPNATPIPEFESPIAILIAALVLISVFSVHNPKDYP